MAKTGEAGWLEQHLEKVVLGVSLLVLLIVGYHWLLSSPLKVSLGQSELSPREVDKALEAQREQLEKRIKEADRPVAPPPDLGLTLRNLQARPFDIDRWPTRVRDRRTLPIVLTSTGNDSTTRTSRRFNWPSSAPPSSRRRSPWSTSSG